MSFTQADLIAMQARLQKNLRPGIKSVDVKETGKGGIQEKIEDYLKSQSHRAWWDVKRTDKRTTSRVGIPDFVGVFDGVAFGLEVKRPGNKPTIDQLGELAWMSKAGAKTAIVYSLEEAVEFFKGLKK